MRSKVHHSGAAYNGAMARPTKPLPRGKRGSVRQSVTIPSALASEVRRVAKDRHITMSRALVSLAEQGVQAEHNAKATLKEAYERFLDEQEPRRKEAAGKDLIRAIFGKDAIAEDKIL
jgi:hypothetical protein